MYDKNAFGESLKSIMIENDLTATKLGKEIKVAPSMVSEWCLHSPDVKLNTLILLSNYFNCNIEFLVGRSDKYEFSSKIDNIDFMKSLQNILKHKAITEYRLIIDIGISRSVFYNWKCGGEPRLSSLIMLADYLDVTLDYLVGRE